MDNQYQHWLVGKMVKTNKGVSSKVVEVYPTDLCSMARLESGDECPIPLLSLCNKEAKGNDQ